MSARTSQHAPDRRDVDGPSATPRPDGSAAHSLRIGRILGIPLQVHWSFLLLLGLVVAAEWPTGAAAIGGGLAWVVALFACVIAHELAHCLLARRRGGTVLGILLLPIGGVSRMEHLPSSSGDEAAVAAAGPATSLLIGGMFLTVGAILGAAIWPPTLVAGSWWARLGWLNLLLGAFNLLPALPMDGGRVLRAALARRLPRLAATRVASSVARVLALGLLVAGIFYDFWLVLIGIFVLLGASREEAMARAEERAARRGQPSGWWGKPYPPAGGESQPAGSPPDAWSPPPDAWPPPWGQEPSPRAGRSAIDVAVERRGPDAAGGEAGGESVGEHH
ncbi:MAG TPA: site-2 protease family protein [Acidimicrobiales bacterium]|nr:site-2 protease family protein [Acidimicrobiales bacterium]